MALTTVTNAGLAGSIDLTAKVTGTLPTGNGGTGSTATTFVNMTSNVTGTLPAANGGTGLTSYAPGKILQCIQTVYKGGISTTSTSYVTSGVEVIITPSAATSKILVMASGGTYDNASDSRIYGAIYYKVTSGGTYAIASVFTSSPESHQEMVWCPSERGGPHSIAILHAPNTTSELYYCPFFKTNSGTGFYNNESAMATTVTAMEVGA